MEGKESNAERIEDSFWAVHNMVTCFPLISSALILLNYTYIHTHIYKSNNSGNRVLLLHDVQDFISNRKHIDILNNWRSILAQLA